MIHGIRQNGKLNIILCRHLILRKTFLIVLMLNDLISSSLGMSTMFMRVTIPASLMPYTPRQRLKFRALFIDI